MRIKQHAPRSKSSKFQIVLNHTEITDIVHLAHSWFRIPNFHTVPRIFPIISPETSKNSNESKEMFPS